MEKQATLDQEADVSPEAAPSKEREQQKKDTHKSAPQPPGELKESLSHASSWFFVAVGFAYATGFIIVSSYLGSFGVQDATGEILRIKYLQIGFYFLFFFGSLVLLSLVTLRAVIHYRTALRSKVEKKNLGLMRMMSLLLPVWIVFLFVIYLVVGFADPHETGRQSLPYVALLVATSAMGCAAVYGLDKALRVKLDRHDRYFLGITWIAYLLLLISVLWISYWVIEPLRTKLLEFVLLQWPIIFILIVYLAVLGWIGYRAVIPRPEMKLDEHKQNMWLRVSIALPIYYLCVLSFAYGVYPFLSVSKAGGYYAGSELVKLTIRPSNAGQSDDPIQPAGSGARAGSRQNNKTKQGQQVGRPPNMPPEIMDPEKQWVLIEENSRSIFVADSNDPKDPPPGHPRGVKCWTDFACRPRVFEISMRNVVRIEHLPRDKGKDKERQK